MDIDINVIKRNLDELNTRIEKTCEKSGRNPSEITLVAVIKNQSAKTLENLFELGYRNFGENRLQELTSHKSHLENIDTNNEIIWNFIGQIQMNKLSKIIENSNVIQSINKISQIDKIKNAIIIPKLYIQIAGNDDVSRGGVTFKDAQNLLLYASEIDIQFDGVMMVPPLGQDPRIHFEQLKNFANQNNLHEISMGMTGDFETAIECGSSTIRIGSAIFKA